MGGPGCVHWAVGIRIECIDDEGCCIKSKALRTGRSEVYVQPEQWSVTNPR